MPYALAPAGVTITDVVREPYELPDDSAAPIMQDDEARRWLSILNSERRKAGWRDADGRLSPSPPMRIHPALQRAAEWKARHMALTRVVSNADTGVIIRVKSNIPNQPPNSEVRERTVQERCWRYGYQGETSEGVGLGSQPVALLSEMGRPGGFDDHGKRINTVHSDALDPRWTDFGFATSEGFSCTLYGRSDRLIPT